MEFPFLDSMEPYRGNNIPDSSNITFCIFTLDIFADLMDISKTEIYDQVKLLMKGDYTFEIYDEHLSYQDYINKHDSSNYIIATDFNRFGVKKKFIINSLNNYIQSHYNTENNLYMTKFNINCLRDARNLFIYCLKNRMSESDTKVVTKYNANTISYYLENPIDANFSKLTSPWNSNLQDQAEGIGNNAMYLHEPYMDDTVTNPYNSCHFLLDGFHYTKQNDTTHHDSFIG